MFQGPQIIAIASAVAAVAAAGIGFLAGRRVAKRRVGPLQAALSRIEAQGREQTRVIARMRNEQRTLTQLFRTLPHMVHELNRSDLDPKSIPRLLIQLADAIYEPEQVLVFEVRKMEGTADPSPRLALCGHRGLAESTPFGPIRIGEGKIGWVAEHLVEMAAEDWHNLTRTEGRAVSNNREDLHLDLMGPIVHRDGIQEHLLGLLCIGKPSVRPRDEKLMLQMVTNLGAIALTNARNVTRLRDQANHDGLTELLNKSYFMRRLGLLINEAERGAKRLSIFIFDIDNFKAYNDSHGHLAGDEILRTMARVVRENLRPGDVACRYGGEEFVIAMPQTDRSDAFRVANRIRQAIQDHPFPNGEHQPGGRLTISGGVAAFPADGTNGTEILSHADQALYQAKGAGRNQVIEYRGIQIGDADNEERIPPPWVSGDDLALER